MTFAPTFLASWTSVKGQKERLPTLPTITFTICPRIVIGTQGVTKILMLLVVAFTQTHGGAEMSPVNLEGVGARITEGMLSLTLHQLLQNLP